ncbi:hypothetical protein AAFF_G00199410 [Aldrovandia affinis]|uniref:Uncharacterized protein n=1 Tax=Aldrovandia affinis TaxID=143900 RepID=A0AAD7W607_9TELE|nr:hypothetical protein AAFF_G00199410 [Aldrovandia affinis]
MSAVTGWGPGSRDTALMDRDRAEASSPPELLDMPLCNVSFCPPPPPSSIQPEGVARKRQNRYGYRGLDLLLSLLFILTIVLTDVANSTSVTSSPAIRVACVLLSPPTSPADSLMCSTTFKLSPL